MGAHPSGCGYIVSEASHPIGTPKNGFPNDARSGRVPMAKHLVTSQFLGCNSYLCDFVSQNDGITGSPTLQDSAISFIAKFCNFRAAYQSRRRVGVNAGLGVLPFIKAPFLVVDYEVLSVLLMPQQRV